MGKVTECPHMSFETNVLVNRLTEEDEVTVIGYSADIRIRCVMCGVPFRFRHGIYGSDPNMATVSVDNTEMRAPIEPEYVKEVLGKPEGEYGHG